MYFALAQVVVTNYHQGEKNTEKKLARRQLTVKVI
jgi:hypothetical protein